MTVKHTIFGNPDAPGAHLPGFIGGVVADEPRAALAAREVLATGGDAADAAVAAGFMLSVTLPSRASLGGGGACLAYEPGSDSPNHGQPQAVMFLPAAPAAQAGDRPASVPMLARGLYLLSAQYGTKPFAELIGPAEGVAAFGAPVSRALARDLAEVGGPLIGDPQARAIFAPNGTVLGEGDKLVQADLAGTLGQIANVGVGDMYQGLLAHKLAEATAQAGGPVSVNDLRSSVPSFADPTIVASGNDSVAFLPEAADRGLAAAAFQGQVAPALPPLPASTSFVVLDRKGGAVACALTLNNLFGTGRVAPGTGMVLSASPSVKPQALLSAAIAGSQGFAAFRAAVAASGQNGAAVAAASAMKTALAGPLPADLGIADPGRANAIGCPGYVPGQPSSCAWTTDSRGAGLAISGQ